MSQFRPLPDAKRHPLTKRLDVGLAPAICPVHDQAVSNGDDGYIDPFTGRWVFTAAYLWQRANCCDSGCRHCPYALGARYRADGTLGS